MEWNILITFLQYNRYNNLYVRSHIPNGVSLDKSNTFFKISFAFIFVCAILCLKIECCGRLSIFECELKLPNSASFFVAVSRTTSEVLRIAVPWIICYEFLQGEEPIISLVALPVNGLAENDNATIHNSQFLGELSVRTVVFQHSTGEQVVLYRLSSEMYVQEDIWRFVSLFLGPCIKLNKGSNTI